MDQLGDQSADGKLKLTWTLRYRLKIGGLNWTDSGQVLMNTEMELTSLYLNLFTYYSLFVNFTIHFV
jgi:hypothetical protein